MSTAKGISELLLRWQVLRQQGERPSAHDLCVDCPELAEELRRRIEAFESMEAMLGMGPARTVAEPHLPGAAAHADTPIASPFLIPGYELLQVIDQGGMGVVYKANQLNLHRLVALKMIAGFRAGPKQVARFRIEAAAVAQLQHPHIVQIFEVGEVAGQSFFSMEYVEGGSLAHKLANGPLAPADSAQLVETLARAIHFAHQRGIIHRDLKPANILLAVVSGQGPVVRENFPPSSTLTTDHRPLTTVPKITDFGLAKRLDADTDHTRTGEIIGTPNYMSPEQAEGKTDQIGPLSDVYALGTILYECLTGGPPFQAKTVMETLRRVISEDPVPPTRLQPKVPRDLEAICLKCLEKSPGRRFATADALADDLRRFVDGRPVLARPLSPWGRGLKWARRRPVRALALLLGVLGLLTVAGWRAYAQEQQRQKAIRVAPQAQEILRRHCFECHGQYPEDVKRKFYVLERSGLLDDKRKIVVPGWPDDSRLIQRIEDSSMPPEEEEQRLPRVSDLETSILKDWIAGGAPAFPPEDAQHPTPPIVPLSPLAGEVKAIFLKYCYECHKFTVAKGGIKILNHDQLVAKRKVVVPGQPEQSELFQLLITRDTEIVMPPTGKPQPKPRDIQTIRRWIAEGAPPFPRGP